ncbi:MAG: long-chain-acyl-CoA synthetase, partial [Deltaproteobacteria bacterium]|nr:long-chain-acyl-CoA synthetase [Deltaproteobacteria bacterium]
IASFHRYLAENLPDYARPVFLRLADYLPITGTYKSQKYKLSCAGYDPSATTDPVYFNDPARQGFVRVDSELYGRIAAGQIRI